MFNIIYKILLFIILTATLMPYTLNINQNNLILKQEKIDKYLLIKFKNLNIKSDYDLKILNLNK